MPCSRWGLPSHESHLPCWCALTAPFHPYLHHKVPAVSFLWHCPSGRPGLPLTTTVLYRVQTFLGSARGGTSLLVRADAIAMADSLARRDCRPYLPFGGNFQCVSNEHCWKHVPYTVNWSRFVLTLYVLIHIDSTYRCSEIYG